MSESTIIIEISESNNAKEFQNSSLIHRNEMDIAKEWITERLSKVHSQTKERLHETITVLGTRGSGKTSFLLSLIEEFKDSEIQILDIIDPTLIEDKGHVFLNVIAAINKLVETKLDLNDCNPTNSDYHTKIAWGEKLKRLANGLPSIDGVGTGLNEQSWQDPEFIMDRGIKAVSSAQELEKNFHEFLNTALIILKKKAFLITFDDIDIDFKKGWPVLETIRKYFTSSQIITVICGELRLFSLGIRRNLIRDIKSPINLSREEESYYNSIITEMEGQYLQKVIKPERRILLTTLAEKKAYLRYLDIDIKVGNRQNKIEDEYRFLLNIAGIQNQYQSKAFSTFLLDLPLRTQIRLFSLLHKEKNQLSTYGIEQAFISELYDKKVQITKLQGNSNILNIEILNLLIRERYLMEGYQLQPISENHSLNCCLMALTFLHTNIVKNKNPALVFDYFIRIGYIRNLLNALDYANDIGSSSGNLTPSINGLIKYSGIKQDGVLRDITGNITAYLRGVLNSQNQTSVVWAGIIPLRALAETQNDKKENVADRIDSVFGSARYDVKTLGYIPLTLSKYSTKNERIPCYSIYTLLATICDLLKMGDSDRDMIRKGLQELSQIRTYTMPDFSNRNIAIDEQTPWSEHQFDDKLRFEHGDLEHEIYRWKKKFPKEAMAPYLLGKISTRFFYALENIQPREEKRLGSLFHAQIVSLMNAILIEDIKENLPFTDININNTVYSDKILINNIEKIKQKHQGDDKLKFSRWMLSCPLLISYVNPESLELRHTLEEFCERERPHYFMEFSVYNYLEQIPLRAVDGKPASGQSSKSNRLEHLLGVVKSRNAPYEWFQIGDIGETRRRNNQIRNALLDLFGNDDETSGKIRELRNYIADQGIQW